jgi:hypothetical protein
LEFSGGDGEVRVRFPPDIGVHETVIDVFESVVALEVRAEFDLFFEQLGVEAEARAAVFPGIVLALVRVEPVVLAVVAAAQFELFKDGIGVVLIERALADAVKARTTAGMIGDLVFMRFCAIASGFPVVLAGCGSDGSAGAVV